METDGFRILVSKMGIRLGSMVISIYFMFAVLVLSGCVTNENRGEDDKISSKDFILSTESPATSAIIIRNTGEETVRFKLKLNGKLYYDEREILEAIRKMTPEYPDEPLRRKAWRFVRDNSTHATPLTRERWQHSPTVFINSVGVGNCDDKASVLSFIWTGFGHKSRVWGLGGHVVAEVFVDSHWEMYDPQYEVYYLTNDTVVAGVEELASNPLLITKAINKLKGGKSLSAVALRYSGYTASKYTTLDNNSVSDYYSEPITSEKLLFDIPSHATFEFPALYEPILMDMHKQNTNGYANAKLTIPPHWTGDIKTPLAIHSIRGSGTLIFKNREYTIESEELQKEIIDRLSFIHKFELHVGKEPVSIVYLINSRLTRLQAQNQLQIEGSQLQWITAELLSLPDSLCLSDSTDEQTAASIEEYSKILRRLNENKLIRTLKVTSKETMYKKVKIFVESDSDLSTEEKADKISRHRASLERIFDNRIDDAGMKLVFNLLDENSLFVLFVMLVETESDKELSYQMRRYLNKRKTI